MASLIGIIGKCSYGTTLKRRHYFHQSGTIVDVSQNFILPYLSRQPSARLRGVLRGAAEPKNPRARAFPRA